MDLLGDQWTLLVLREAFNGIRRFDRFQAELGIARNTLTERLDRLTGAGLLDRVRYQDRPARYEYPLTEMGRDFFPVLAAIIRWGDQWLADPAGPPTLVRHLDCDEPTSAAVSCAHCGGDLTADRVVMEPGPGVVSS
jgi:DNA-binding HxlR family transcriptional regulator